MCGITINNQEGNYKVEDLKLKDGQRTTLVSTNCKNFSCLYEQKEENSIMGTEGANKHKKINSHKKLLGISIHCGRLKA